MGFPGGSDGKESACNAGDPGSLPGSGRFPDSSIVWRSLWTEEPGGPQSMGSPRVGHDWATKLSLFQYKCLAPRLTHHHQFFNLHRLETPLQCWIEANLAPTFRKKAFIVAHTQIWISSFYFFHFSYTLFIKLKKLSFYILFAQKFFFFNF